MSRRSTFLAIAALLLLTRSAFPAGCGGTGTACFWVCGSAGGNTSTTSCWATTSGGATTGSVPTATEDCVFDGQSGGAGTATVNSTLTCKNLYMDGTGGNGAYGNTLTVSAAVNAAASVKLAGTVTGVAAITFNGTGASSLTTGGITVNCGVTVSGVGVAVTLQDDFVGGTGYTAATSQIALTQGTFNANGHNVTCTAAQAHGCMGTVSNSLTRGWTLGSGTFKQTFNSGSAAGSTAFQINPATQTGFTLSAASAKFILQQDDSTVGSMTYLSTTGAWTVGDVTVQGSGSRTINVVGAFSLISPTMANFTMANTGAGSLVFGGQGFGDQFTIASWTENSGANSTISGDTTGAITITGSVVMRSSVTRGASLPPLTVAPNITPWGLSASGVTWPTGPTVKIPTGTATSVTAYSLSGASGKTATLQSTSSGTQATMRAAGGFSVSIDYTAIKDSRAEGTCWYAGPHSTNTSNNAGWIFVTNSPVCPTGAAFGGGI